MKYLAAAIAVALNIGPAHAMQPTGAEQNGTPQRKVLKTYRVTGSLVSFTTGDFVHARIKYSNGKLQYFHVLQPEPLYFLAIHPRKRVTLTVAKVSDYFAEVNSKMTIDEIVSVSYGGTTSAQWWNRQLRTSTRPKLIDKYEPAFQKLSE